MPFTYNEISINDPILLSYSQTEEEGFTKYEIEIAGVIEGDVFAIRSKLLCPRKKLFLQINGKDLIPQRDQMVDAKNGPIPLSCRIKQLSPNKHMIQYRIRTTYGSQPIQCTNCA